VHRLVHLKDIEKMKDLMKTLELNKKQIQKVNELRKHCGNDSIINWNQSASINYIEMNELD
ncbi:hypothetical protein FZC79_17870, partial [Rossellomorea vietnamensis]